jgi:arginyl-tRNA synthetase
MKLTSIISEGVAYAVKEIYKTDIKVSEIQVQETRKEFEGDLTIVVFPLLKLSKKSPEATAQELGAYLEKNMDIVEKFNVIKGFLNLSITSGFYLTFLKNEASNGSFGVINPDSNSKTFMVEYSSPNTNKPLHLGHIRNNLLGWSVCQILKANGNHIVKTNIVNDRGIHICKSMLAWQKWGRGETPESTGKKGDHLVGDYYVKFDQEYKKQITELKAQGKSDDEAAKNAPLINEAQEMLRKWEAKDSEIYSLWKMMNGWVYSGFDITYKQLGVDFDKIYFESDTYMVGRNTVISGLDKGVFYKRPDNSVWVDLTKDGLDEKLLLRSDGTSVYMTQDIGTAQLRQMDYSPDKMVYVVGNEQNYHFKVLALILDKLGFSWAKDLYHLSYGMVELPEGKMKSREGTVVDADVLMDEMISTSKSMADELGKLEGLTQEEKENIYRIIGLGALKYFILKVDPTKNMTFNPKESIDFNGNTGPFIQYTHARIRSVIRKADELGITEMQNFNAELKISEKEKTLLKLIYSFPEVIAEAAHNYSPALVANYIYEVAKEYNQFYHDFPILKEENQDARNFKLVLSKTTGSVIKTAMRLLGIEVPERM